MRYARDHVRKVCRCPRSRWGTCPHPWHFAFFYRRAYRFSLDKYLSRHLGSWAEVRDEADKIRLAIKAGTFNEAVVYQTVKPQALTLAAFSEVWKTRVGSKLVAGRIHGYRPGTICGFLLPSTTPPTTLGAKSLDHITTDDIEAFRDARKADDLSVVAVNHDLKLLRAMFNWAIRKGYVSRTPFKLNGVSALSLEREIPRHRRFESADDEVRVLAASGPDLKAVIIGMLDTACRPGEILNLQWRDVSLERREFVVQAVKAKTRTMRMVPISTRLHSILELRRLDPAGEQLPGTAYVFGNELGQPVKNVRDAWIAAADAAGLKGFQLRDLRHEAACRFEDAGTPVSDVAKLLGHTSITTTSRYLMNTQRRALRRAVDRLERHAALPRPSDDAEDDDVSSATNLAEFANYLQSNRAQRFVDSP